MKRLTVDGNVYFTEASDAELRTASIAYRRKQIETGRRLMDVQYKWEPVVVAKRLP